MLEAASFPSDNKIVSQVVRNIIGLRSNGGVSFPYLRKLALVTEGI